MMYLFLICVVIIALILFTSIELYDSMNEKNELTQKKLDEITERLTVLETKTNNR